MKVISSKDNKIFKQCQSLLTKKYRDKLGLYLVEGDKLVEEACNAGLVDMLIYRGDYSKGIHYQGEDIVFMEGKLFEKLAQTKTSQGCIAVVRKQKTTLEQFKKHICEDHGNVVVLDRLQDPGNIGTIIRTCDAAEYKGIIALKETADIYSMKVIRAAAGSVLRLPILHVDTTEEAVAILKDCGKQIIGTTLDTDIYANQVDMSKDTAVVIGNEGNGMSETFKKATDINVKIQMNPKVDSLNAAVAAGIIIYQSKGSVINNGK